VQRRSGESLRRHEPVEDRLTTRVSVTLKDGSTKAVLSLEALDDISKSRE
jgi:hypothetical protein